MEKVTQYLISAILSYKVLNQGMFTVAEVCTHGVNGVTSRDINTVYNKLIDTFIDLNMDLNR